MTQLRTGWKRDRMSCIQFRDKHCAMSPDVEIAGAPSVNALLLLLQKFVGVCMYNLKAKLHMNTEDTVLKIQA